MVHLSGFFATVYILIKLAAWLWKASRDDSIWCVHIDSWIIIPMEGDFVGLMEPAVIFQHRDTVCRRFRRIFHRAVHCL